MVASAQFEDRSGFQSVGGWQGNSMGIVKATEGLSFTDSTFAANWANLKKAGLPRGAYHFFHPGLPVVPQIGFFLATVASHGLEHGDVLALDQEIWVGAAGEMAMEGHSLSRMHTSLVSAEHPEFTAAVAASSLGSIVKQALDEIKAGAAVAAGPGHTPVWLYTMGSMLGPLSPCTGYGLWIAHPGTSAPSVPPWATWRAWQYTAGGGPGGGDKDAFNGTHDDLMAYIRTFQDPVPPPPPPGKATQPSKVWASTRFTNATINWSGARFPAGVPGGFKVDIVDAGTGVHVQPSVELPPAAVSHKFGGLKFRHKYKLGVYAQPGAPGSHSQWVTARTL